MDGAFEGLRAYGAFLVSGEYAAGRIESFKVVSEKGTRLRICNPWPGQRVRCICDGEAVQLHGDILELDTIKGAQYCFSAVDGQLYIERLRRGRFALYADHDADKLASWK